MFNLSEEDEKHVGPVCFFWPCMLIFFFLKFLGSWKLKKKRWGSYLEAIPKHIIPLCTPIKQNNEVPLTPVGLSGAHADVAAVELRE